MYSPSPATSTSSFSKILVLISSSGVLDLAWTVIERRAVVTDFPANKGLAEATALRAASLFAPAVAVAAANLVVADMADIVMRAEVR